MCPRSRKVFFFYKIVYPVCRSNSSWQGDSWNSDSAIILNGMHNKFFIIMLAYLAEVNEIYATVL
jgi:hypothetical protein